MVWAMPRSKGYLIRTGLKTRLPQITKTLAVVATGMMLLWIPVRGQSSDQTFGSSKVPDEGFVGRVYQLEEGTSSLPDFDELQRPETTIYTKSLNIPRRNWTEGFPGVPNLKEWFAIRYEGEFYVEEEGSYRFTLDSDDGSKLYIDGKLVIDNGGVHAMTAKTSEPVFLSESTHTVTVEYFQGPRRSIGLRLLCSLEGSSSGNEVFPHENFQLQRPPGTGPTLLETVSRVPFGMGLAMYDLGKEMQGYYWRHASRPKVSTQLDDLERRIEDLRDMRGRGTLGSYMSKRLGRFTSRMPDVIRRPVSDWASTLRSKIPDVRKRQLSNLFSRRPLSRSLSENLRSFNPDEVSTAIRQLRGLNYDKLKGIDGPEELIGGRGDSFADAFDELDDDTRRSLAIIEDAQNNIGKTDDLFRRVGKWASRGGKVAGAAGAVLAIESVATADDKGEALFEEAAAVAGGYGGGYAGAAAGAAVGGPVGATVGFVVGSVGGSVAGSEAGDTVYNAAADWGSSLLGS